MRILAQVPDRRQFVPTEKRDGAVLDQGLYPAFPPLDASGFWSRGYNILFKEGGVERVKGIKALTRSSGLQQDLVSSQRDRTWTTRLTSAESPAVDPVVIEASFTPGDFDLDSRFAGSFARGFISNLTEQQLRTYIYLGLPTANVNIGSNVVANPVDAALSGYTGMFLRAAFVVYRGNIATDGFPPLGYLVAILEFGGGARWALVSRLDTNSPQYTNYPPSNTDLRSWSWIGYSVPYNFSGTLDLLDSSNTPLVNLRNTTIYNRTGTFKVRLTLNAPVSESRRSRGYRSANLTGGTAEGALSDTTYDGDADRVIEGLFESNNRVRLYLAGNRGLRFNCLRSGVYVYPKSTANLYSWDGGYLYDWEKQGDIILDDMNQAEVHIDYTEDYTIQAPVSNQPPGFTNIIELYQQSIDRPTSLSGSGDVDLLYVSTSQANGFNLALYQNTADGLAHIHNGNVVATGTPHFAGLKNRAYFIAEGMAGVQQIDFAQNVTIGAQISGSPTGKFVFLFGPHLLVVQDEKIVWSDSGDFSKWDISATDQLAGEIDLFNFDRKVIAAEFLGDRLMLYTATEMGAVSYLGGTFVFGFRKLLDNTGAISRKSIVSVGSRHYGLARKGFWVSNGTEVRAIDDPVNAYMDANCNWDRGDKVVAFHDQREGIIIWFYPEGLATENNRAIVYNYRDNTWTILNIGITALDKERLFGYPVVAGSGNVSAFGIGDEVLGSSINSEVFSKPLDFRGPERGKFVQALRLSKTGECRIKIWGLKRPPENYDNLDTEADAFEVGDGAEDVYLQGMDATYFVLKVSGTDAWRLTSLSILGEYTGRRVDATS